MKITRFSLIKWGTLLFLFALPLGVKKFLFYFPTPFTNFYTSEYNSAFLFGADILIILLVLLSGKGFFAWLGEWFKKNKWPAVLLVLFLAFSLLSAVWAGYKSFAIYSFIRLFLAVAAGLFVGYAVKENFISFKSALAAVSVSAVFESVIGFFQFIAGKSLGLWFLGETVFGPGTPGIARVTVNGLSFARAYGTMPHANILAGFLVLGLLSFFWLFIREEKFWRRVLSVAGIFTVLAGLLATFSRSGWITAGIASAVFFVWEFLADRERRKRVLYLVSLLLVSCVLLFSLLGWAIFPRASFSAEEQPVADRLAYDRIGSELIVSNPLGVGIGNELFFAYRNGYFARYGVNSLGQWQPIHNLYLMVSSETGILNLLFFLAFLGLLVSRGFNNGEEYRFALAALSALLFFGLFDHFLWDLELGRLMLWAVVGLLIGVSSEKNNPER